MKIKNKHFLLVAAACVAAMGLVVEPEQASGYSVYCKTAACRAAADREAAAQAKRVEAAQNVHDAESAINNMNEEINALTEEINVEKATVDDLDAQIKETEEELQRDKEGLAKLLVNIHFTDTPSAISLLAGSSSLSDYSDKQTRQDTVKERIDSSIQEVAKKEEDLNKQRVAQQAIVDELNEKYAELNTKQNELERKRAEYAQDEAAYKKDAEKAASERAAMEQEALNDQLRNAGTYGTGARTSSTLGSYDPSNTYPWKGICPDSNLAFLTTWGYVCQCTSYAGWKASERWGVSYSNWGNANTWGYYAARAGYRVDSVPAPNTVAVSTAGEWGHVMWVESVNANGTINISEYNNYYSAASHRMGDYGTRAGVGTAGLQFIHFN